LDRTKTFREIQNRVIDSSLVTMAVLSGIATLGSLSRVFVMGWHPIFEFHIGNWVMVILLAVFRQRIPYHIKSITFVCWLGATGFVALAWAGNPGGTSFLILALIYITILYGVRVAVWFIGLCALLLTGIGVAAVHGWLTFFIDITLQRTIPSFWISHILVFAVLVGVAIVGLHRFHQFLTETVAALDYRTRELTEARNAAETANRAKSRFLANMSHEIRTPMNAILGYAQLMQRDPRLSEEQRRNLDVINRSGEHLLSLINDVLDMSRIEAGRIGLQSSTIDLSGLLVDLEAMFRLRTEEKDLTLDLTIDKGVPRCVVADEGKLRQVLVNLLGNAAKFTEEGGVTLRTTTQTEGQASGAGPLLHIEVTDSGVGIQPQVLEQIFLPFEQTGEEHMVEGTGLGLAISREYARLMGGDITVRSEVGQGSSFLLTLPLQPGDEAEIASEPRAPIVGLAPGQGEIRVLVADDRQTNRDVARMMLEPLGFSVREARDGAEAVREYEAWMPQIVLMDIVMPVMGGIESARRIRQVAGERAVAVIAVTASALEEEVEEILSQGADAVVRKPYREAELLGQIARLGGIAYAYEEEEGRRPGSTESGLSLGEARQAASSLPPPLRRGLEEAALDLDHQRLSELTAEVEPMDPRLARTIHDLLAGYDYDGLIGIIKTGDDP
jgi:signal transduction histidine kinase/CheY-like chemotaxis protein